MAPRTPVDPGLPGSCARAATAAEARYRIQRPIAPARAPRIIALDDGAGEVVRGVAELEWATARFYTWRAAGALHGVSGGTATLDDELASADVVVMVATDDAGADAARTIGEACFLRGIMTAGLVIGTGINTGIATRGGAGETAGRAVAALRPYARVLLPGADVDDLVELLRALRA
ncbi:hypothetical protein [Pseudonocardia thermophila]|uniref:hypothetical protein n=1 Tax=Pseudonocardia thermophila TaxID=1848 RepID=UPI00248F0807|nr:hypothetical protein [Pseudonocardia thermophila]